MPPSILTAANIDYIKLHRLEMSGTHMAKHFGVSKGIVNRYMRFNGLAVSRELHNLFTSKSNSGRSSSDKATDKILEELYLTVPLKRLAKQINRSSAFVNGRLRQLKLIVPIEIIQERKNSARFKPGSVSFNTGKKQTEYMSAEAIEKTKAFRFHKGYVPPNTRTDGEFSDRMDKSGYTYRYIRTSLAKWELYHRIVWQQAHGTIPSGSLITFKDGNALNCSLNNLEVITKRENAIRNRAKFLILPKELQKTKVLLTKIKNLTNV